MSFDLAGDTQSADPSAFLPGLELNARFYAEAVRPLLDAAFPGLPHAAALVGEGSDVLGFDTPRSTDHDWGPRLRLFLAERDHAEVAPAVDRLLRQRLPPRFLGYPTGYLRAPDGVRVPAGTDAPGEIAHNVAVDTAGRFVRDRLGLDPHAGLTAVDWLVLPQQRLLELTGGPVYHDGVGELTAIRDALAAEPPDVWRYQLAGQWLRVGQQQPFVGRAGEAGDETGSRLLAHTLVRDLMRLGFLLERRRAPYGKWFGTAFARLAIAPELTPALDAVLTATTWPERDQRLAEASGIVARRHNALGLHPPLPDRASPFHSRPFRVIHGDRFADAVAATIEDAELRGVIDRAGLVGAVDQITDNVDLLTSPDHCLRLRALYRG